MSPCDACPELTERWLCCHVFACARYGCGRPIRWRNHDPAYPVYGWCEDHAPTMAVAFTATPICIYGRLG